MLNYHNCRIGHIEAIYENASPNSFGSAFRTVCWDN